MLTSFDLLEQIQEAVDEGHHAHAQRLLAEEGRLLTQSGRARAHEILQRKQSHVNK